jgi:hypothetical protein
VVDFSQFYSQKFSADLDKRELYIPI